VFSNTLYQQYIIHVHNTTLEMKLTRHAQCVYVSEGSIHRPKVRGRVWDMHTMCIGTNASTCIALMLGILHMPIECWVLSYPLSLVCTSVHIYSYIILTT